MTVSRVAKSETRQLVEQERHRSRLGEPTDWAQPGKGAWFLPAFVAIAAALTVLALVLR